MKHTKTKNIISIVTSFILLMSSITAFAELQTTFSSDLSDQCGYITGDTVDTVVTNFIVCKQQYFPKGAIASWNNPDDYDAESIKLFKNGEEIVASWNLGKGSFNKIGVDALDKNDVFTLKLKKNGEEKTYEAKNMLLETVIGDWKLTVGDVWKSSSAGTNFYGNGAVFIDSSQGYNSSTSLKFISNHFQPLESGTNKDHNENVSNDAKLKATWTIPQDQGTLENGVTYQLRYMVKTVNADRLHLWCNKDADRWNGQKCNQNIYRNSDWVEKTKTFTKTDQVTSFTFSVAQKCDEIAIDDIRIGTYDEGTDTFTPLIVETFEPDLSKYEPTNFFLAPGAGVKSVSWVNPKADNVEKISLYSVDEAGEELIRDNYDTGAGVRQHYSISSSVNCVKIVFDFKDGKSIQLFASVDNKTLYGATIPQWKFGLNQQGTFKYNPAKFVVDTENNAGAPGTASVKIVSNHTNKVANTFVTARHSGWSVEEGKKYGISFWVKSDKSADSLKATVSYSEKFDGYTSTSVAGTVGSYDWKKLEFTYTATSTGTKDLGFEIPYQTNGFWIDNIEIYELNELDEPIGENLAVNGDVSDFGYPEGKPANIKAEGKSRGITLSWKNNEGYESIWLYEKNGDEWIYRGSVSSSLSEVSFSGLKGDTEYTYKIVPVTAYGVPGEEQTVSARVEPNYGNCGANLTWTLDDNRTLTISGTGDMTNYEGYGSPWSNDSFIKTVVIDSGVTSIGYVAFYGCSSLTSITIPDSVTKIGDRAFYNCSGLTSITIPDGVTSIGDYAFYGCSSLTSITIPDSVTSIGYGAFHYCQSLTSITIGSGVTSIADGAFDGCSSLTSITIGSGVTSIGDSAFDGYSSLTDITIPDSVTSIGNYAFRDCSSLTDITIPDSVTSIGDYAFYDCSSLTSITIGSGVTSIGDRAFSYCSSLTSITIPDSVTSIGYWAFRGCSSLTSITIPDSVTSIGYGAFSYCSSLTSITIGSGVTSIGDYAFDGCSSLTSINVSENNQNYSSQDGVLFNKDKTTLICCIVGKRGSYTIPDSVTSIGDYAFDGCSGLTSIIIPDGVTNIGNSAFRGCSGLTSITIPDGVTSIGNYAFAYCHSLTSAIIGDSVTRIGYGAFCDCSGLTSITIPDGVTSIGNYAFYNCSSLTSITIPDGVTSIGDYAFEDCSSLTSITIGSGVTSIGNYAFSYCSGLTSITIPDGVTSIGNYAFEDCSSLTSITIPDGVTNIGNRAFYDCSSLTSITIGSGVKRIGYGAFRGCSSITSITIPDSVTRIGYDAFESCSSLTSITIPDSVTSIGDYAFRGCSSLTSITIGSGVTSIGDRAFYNCSGLTSITIGSGVTSIGDYAFEDCSSLTSITIPDSVTSIGNYAFSYCYGLTSITIPDGVTSIGDYAFESCSGLTSIIIPDGVTNIGNRAFSGCSSLTSITIPDGVTSIGNYAFSGCRGLTSIIIPDSVTSIGNDAFYNCSSLTSITIPDSVTKISYEAFYNCSSLTSITIPDSVTKISNEAFCNCSSLTSITIPDSVTSIGAYAFSGCHNLTDVYYDGAKEDWNIILIDSSNDPLKEATIHYNMPSIKVRSRGNIFTVTPKNIATGNSIIFAVYKDGKIVDMQTEFYYGENSVFYVTVPYDTVKAMVWKNFTSMEPLCPLKTISQ